MIQRLRLINIVLFILLIGLSAILLAVPYPFPFEDLLLRLTFLCLVALSASALLKAASPSLSWLQAVTASTIFTFAALKAASFLPSLSTHPLSLDWSEGSRYFYASLFFSRSLYGIDAPLPVLHPAQYLLQSVPFLIPGSPIWLHRLWQVLLWISTPLLSAWLLSHRLALHNSLHKGLFIAWSFLFLLIGPVFYHLFLPFILILALFLFPVPTRLRTAISFAALILASIWAGICRVNWFPVPAFLAASLFLLEQPIGSRNLSRYLLHPFLWVFSGTALALASYLVYIRLSGNPLHYFASSFTSNLLWRRLLPNPTFPPGILLAISAVSLPLLLIFALQLFNPHRRFHPIRPIGLAAMLLVVLAEGLVVSTKIGGGSNLHNMDAFLSLLWVISAYLFFGRFSPDLTPTGEQTLKLPSNRLPALRRLALTLAILAPLPFALLSVKEVSLPGREDTAKLITRLQDYATEASKNSGEVLFIANRQLLTFHEIEGIPLVPEYERVFLMEMAMANNETYLETFYNDLKKHRFSLIVVEPSLPRTDTGIERFSIEDDIWYKYVWRELMCTYEPYKTFSVAHLQLLVPRENPGANCQ